MDADSDETDGTTDLVADPCGVAAPGIADMVAGLDGGTDSTV